MTNKTSLSFTPDRNENVFVSLLFNIFIPALLLKHLTNYLLENNVAHGPLIALLVAIAFPTYYGLNDYLKHKRKNLISVLGFLNTLLTGGLGLFQVEGIWFAVKEAAFPLLIGGFVFATIYSDRPFIKLFFFNEAFLKIQLIYEKLEEKGTVEALEKLLRKSTVFLASSFLLSAVLNFALARYIFQPIDGALPETEQAAILNEQIADMLWWSWPVIAIPTSLVTIAIFTHLFKGIQKLTGLSFKEVLRVH